MLKKLILAIFVTFVFTITTKADQLTVLHHKNYYPYAFINANGLSDGILVDYWKLWGKKNKVDISFIAANESRFIELINNDSAHLVAGISFSNTFNDEFDFSEYILRVKTVLFLKKKLRLKSVHDINFPLPALKKFNTKELINEKYSFLDVTYCKSLHELTDKISTPENNGFIYDYPSPIIGETNIDIPKGYAEFLVLENNRIRPAVKKGNSELQSLIIKGSKRISDQEMQELANKWEIAVQKTSYLWVLLLTIVVLAGLLVFYIYALRKQKKQARIIKDFESSQEWQVLINKGENDYIEFKSSLRWDYRQDKMNKALESIIAKTISAFLNTDGGMLFIGVDDEGNALGLDKDYSTFSKKNKDGFLLAMTTMINNNLGKTAHKFISLNIISLNNKDVCIVKLEKSNQPVFIGKGDKDEFFIRASASSQALGMRETYDYINSHWKNS